jgi:hypothetical protein
MRYDMHSFALFFPFFLPALSVDAVSTPLGVTQKASDFTAGRSTSEILSDS